MTMKATTLSKAITALVVVFGCVTSGWAAVSFSVDMDLGTAGIQNTRAASPGDIFSVGLVLSVDAAGVSSYGVSVNFDNTELSLNGSPASTELLPAGLTFNITPGVASESQPLGQVRTFEAATFGLGPVSTSFTVGTISYKALVPVSDGLADVSLGFFNTGIDGYFDNAGNPVVPTFNPGYLVVVPEPSIMALLFGGTLSLWLARRRSLG
jgi:hypothetical protein